MKIKYSPESIEDLQRVVEFVENKNPYAARRIAIDLQESVDRLKQFPEIGLPVLTEQNPQALVQVSPKIIIVAVLLFQHS